MDVQMRTDVIVAIPEQQIQLTLENEINFKFNQPTVCIRQEELDFGTDWYLGSTFYLCQGVPSIHDNVRTCHIATSIASQENIDLRHISISLGPLHTT